MTLRDKIRELNQNGWFWIDSGKPRTVFEAVEFTIGMLNYDETLELSFYRKVDNSIEPFEWCYMTLTMQKDGKVTFTFEMGGSVNSGDVHDLSEMEYHEG